MVKKVLIGVIEVNKKALKGANEVVKKVLIGVIEVNKKVLKGVNKD